jgi:hypothetical protein
MTTLQESICVNLFFVFTKGGTLMDISDANKMKWTVFAAIFMVSMIPACAGVAPMEKMVKLESQITNARQAEAIVYSPLELKFAEDKYRLAQDAIEDKEYDVARQLADEALLDAQFAEIKALSVRAEKEAQEMRESIETLRTELNRIQTR